MRRSAAVIAFGLLAFAASARADAASWLRSENKNVREGNDKLGHGDAKAALAAYDKAARELPSEGGVHLDRGLALMRAGELDKAREALRLATQPPASPEVRADAYYDLGNAFYKEADARAGENKHDEAQQLFREAADAYKHALRLRPGDRNTGWNYELSARRIREQEEKQKQKEKQDPKNDQQKSDQQKNDQQKNDQDQQGDQQKQDPSKKDQDPQNAQKPDDKSKDKSPQPQPKDDAQKKQPEPQAGQQKEQQARPEVERALDALEDSEQNLERMKAMNRAARERRKPEKDW